MPSSISLAVALKAALVLSTALPRHSEYRANNNWSGWENIKHAFIFGDSYTQTGFDYTSTNPTPENPLGNPPYPGWTSSNGPNWVGFLTTKYNGSVLQTYNLAYGGATVDSDLVAPYDPSVVSLKEQIRTEFLPGYTGESPAAPGAPAWSGADSVFAVWIGINDVGNSWSLEAARRDALYAQIFDLYAALAGQLVAAGARNLVLIDVPPVDRSPLTTGQGPDAQAGEREAIALWNGRVTDLAAGLRAAHAGDDDDGVNVWTYSSSASFGAALDDPTVFEATAAMKNVTEFCTAYQNGTPEWDSFDASCGVPVNEYFWLNSLHPTYPIHDVVAQQVAEALAAGPNVY